MILRLLSTWRGGGGGGGGGGGAIRCPCLSPQQCFPFCPIRTAYPSYFDISLFNRSNSSKDWPRVRKIELFIIHFFHPSVTRSVVNQIFSPLSEAWSIRAYSKPKLMGTLVLSIHAFRNLQKKELHVKKVSITFQNHCPKRTAGETVLQLKV